MHPEIDGVSKTLEDSVSRQWPTLAFDAYFRMTEKDAHYVASLKESLGSLDLVEAGLSQIAMAPEIAFEMARHEDTPTIGQKLADMPAFRDFDLRVYYTLDEIDQVLILAAYTREIAVSHLASGYDSLPILREGFKREFTDHFTIFHGTEDEVMRMFIEEDIERGINPEIARRRAEVGQSRIAQSPDPLTTYLEAKRASLKETGTHPRLVNKRMDQEINYLSRFISGMEAKGSIDSVQMPLSYQKLVQLDSNTPIIDSLLLAVDGRLPIPHRHT